MPLPGDHSGTSEAEVRGLGVKGQPGLHSEVEAEVRVLQVKGQTGLHSEVLPQNKTNNNKKAQYTKQTQQNHM